MEPYQELGGLLGASRNPQMMTMTGAMPAQVAQPGLPAGWEARPAWGTLMGDNIWKAARGLGYAGPETRGATNRSTDELISLLGLSPEQLSSIMKVRNPNQSFDINRQKLDELALEKPYRDWLQQNGYRLDQFDSGNEYIDRLYDAQGKMVAEDVYNYAADSAVAQKLGVGGLLAIATMGALGPGGFGGAEASGGMGGAGGAEAGIGTLEAGATGGGGISAQSIGAAELAGVPTSASLSTPLSLAPSTVEFGAVAGAGAGTGAGLSSLDKAALYGAEGYGAGMSGLQTTVYDGLMNTFGSGALANAGANLAGNPLVQGLVDGASNLSSLSNLIPGGGSSWASLLGGLAGVADGKGGQTAGTQTQIDPRMAHFLYGSGPGDTNSLLGAGFDWWKNNKSGLNDTMRQGLEMQRAALTDPAYSQGLLGMRNQGMGLLNTPVAGNPFTQGRQAPTGLLGAPQMPPALSGLLGAPQQTQPQPGPTMGILPYERGPFWEPAAAQDELRKKIVHPPRPQGF